MKQAHPGKPSRPTRWWSQTGSNRRPHACKARALPTELWPLRAGSRQIGSRQSKNRRPRMPTACCRMPKAYSPLTNLVGLGGLEPPTSRLSSARSNQLSYKPLSENIGGLQPQRHSPQAEARNSRHRGSTPTSEQKERRRRRRPANAVFDKTAVSKRPIKAFDKEDLNPQAIAGSEPLIRDMTLERR